MEAWKLKGQMERMHITQKQMAEVIGCTERTFNSKINGPGEFDLVEIRKMCDKLELSQADIIDIFFTAPVN